MIPALLAVALLPACSTYSPYRPDAWQEKVEFNNDRSSIFPEDVRKDPIAYTRNRVAWAGIILRNEATVEKYGGNIRMDTVFEHHYFDWKQTRQARGTTFAISPRGEGRFRMTWYMNRKAPDTTEADAIKFAAPGDLAIVYGTPEAVDDDGTIMLRYHYVRIIKPGHFMDSKIDYGRPAVAAPSH
jgi:hypothetical protein